MTQQLRELHNLLYPEWTIDALDINDSEDCIIGDAVKEIGRLREIVGSMPRTADGVLIVPGMTAILSGRRVTVGLSHYAHGCCGVNLASRLYSTPEAYRQYKEAGL